MMKLFGIGRMDRYVARTTLWSYLICLFFIMGLVVLSDLVMNFEDFQSGMSKLEGGTAAVKLVLYYGSYLPFVFLQTAPFVTVVASMFAVSRLMGSNEIVPMLFTGRSLNRVLMPVFAVAVLATLAMGAIREYVTPKLFTVKDDLAATLKGREGRVYRNLIFPIEDRLTVLASEYIVEEDRLVGLKVYDKRNDGVSIVITEADDAVFQDHGSFGRGWYLKRGRRIQEGQEKVQRVPFLMYANFDPVLLRKLMKNEMELLDLSYSDCLERLDGHAELTEILYAFHHHFAFPLANLVLILLALPFALKFERGSKAERVVFALLVCGVYLITDLICQNLGARASLHPVVAAWFPTVLFGSLGVVMFDAVRT